MLLDKNGITRCHALVSVIVRSQDAFSGCELDCKWCSALALEIC